MKLNNNITQKELNEANLEKISNRIKLRELSLNNLKDGVKSIPYQEVQMQPEVEIQSAEVSEEKKDNSYQLIEVNELKLVNGSGRPISVKEGMFNKLKKYGATEKVNENEVEDKVTPEIKVEESNIKVESKEEKTSEINKTEKKENKNKNTKLNDIEKYFEENKTKKEQFLRNKNEAAAIKEDNRKLDEKLQTLAKNNKENAEMIREAEEKNSKLTQELIDALKEQNNTLAAQNKQCETEISDGNKMKEFKQKKVLESESENEKQLRRLSDVNNEVARKEEILAAIKDTTRTEENMNKANENNNIININDNIVQFYGESNNYEEENVRRIA